MTNWKDIHPDFTPELQKEWEEKGFGYEECKEWIKIGGLEVDDSGFVEWLVTIKKYDTEQFPHDSEKKIRKEYKNFLEEVIAGTKISVKLIKQIRWFEQYYNVSRYDEMNPEQEWFVEQLIPNDNLRERYKECRLCNECQQIKTNFRWCQTCNALRFKKNFNNWTSGNSEIDKIIQQHQIKAIDTDNVLEWIPYEKITDAEYLAEGGFGKVYKAKWIDGPIDGWGWDFEKNQWRRRKDHKENYKSVVLKIINDSQTLTPEFLNEVVYHKLVNDDKTSGIIGFYGISQDPSTGNYIMVMDYKKNGDLRSYLKNDNKKLSFSARILQLSMIASGLANIHERGLMHCDLHAGNILNGNEDVSYITDLGLCRPANETDNSKIYGVLPYLAPEVLRGQPYTQSSDIYSFGMIAYELLTGLPPHYDRSHDIHLALAICDGLRPAFNIKIPKLLGELIEDCWDSNPTQRPTADELSSILFEWWREINPYKQNTGFADQFQEAEEYNQTLPEQIKFPEYEIHPQAFYYSRPINTKKITELLKETDSLDALRIGIPKNLNLENNSSVNNNFVTYEFADKNEARLLESEELSPIKIKSTGLTKEIENLLMKEEEQELQTEPMETDDNWQILHSALTPQQLQSWHSLNFTPSLINEWRNQRFSPNQVRDYLSIGLSPSDHHFASFLRDQKHLTPEKVLNHGDINTLNQEFFNYWQGQQTQKDFTESPSRIIDNSLIEISPK